MTYDPRLLRSFVVLAEELHFGRAARRLHVSQPALSQQLARLEAQLGVRLLIRTRTHVELSEAGRAALEPARTAVRAGDAAAALARDYAAGERGELRLGLSPGVHYVAQPLLADFARRRPGVRISAREHSTGLLTRLVAAGALELAIGFCCEPSPGVRSEPLLDERAVLAVSRTHPLARRREVRLADLRGETFALVDPGDGPGYNEAVRERCRTAGFEPSTNPAPHGPMAWETAVRSGGCVGLTTRSAAPSTALDVSLVELRPRVTFPIALLCSQTMGPAGQAFAELARRRAAG